MAENQISQLSPKLGPRQPVYQDRNREIHRVLADFGAFTKEYLVVESGHRAALLVVRDSSCMLVRQYRLLINGLSWEIPGGKVDDGETPEAAAIRECLEETGLLCRSIKPLLVFHPGLDSYHNPTHLFYTDQYASETVPEANPREVVSRSWVPIPRCLDMIFGGEIVDSLSIVAILSYQTWLGRHCP